MAFRLGRLAMLVVLGGLLPPGLSSADEQRWPLRGLWLGHTGPRIGVQVQSMTPELRAYFGVDHELGVLVSRVDPDSPAARAEIQAGDVILSANGEPVRDPGDLIGEVLATEEGEKVKIGLSRRGEEREVEVEPRPRQVHGRRGLLIGPELMEELREQIRELEERLRELEQRLSKDTEQT